MYPIPAAWVRFGRIAISVGACFCAARVFGQPNYATPYYFTTLAGSGTAGATDGTGTAASFNAPHGVAVDGAGNVYVADTGNSRVRKITPAGVVTTLRDAAGTPLAVGESWGIAIDANGNLYLGGHLDSTIRKISPSGVLSAFVSQPSSTPDYIAIDSTSTLYVTYDITQVIRKVTSAGVVSDFAGIQGIRGSTDGAGANATFANPVGVGIDTTGTLYVADSGNALIRKLTSAAAVTTFAGTAGTKGSLDGPVATALFNEPAGVAVDSARNVFISDIIANTIRRISSTGVVTTLAGTPNVSGRTDGLGAAARFSAPFSIAVDRSGNLYVADTFNHVIRRSVFGPTVTGDPPLSVNPGTNVTLTTVVTSDVPVTLQWRKNDVAIAGATNSVLLLTNVQAADAAIYSLAATNVAGTASAATPVLVNAPPTITTQPASQTATAGSTVEFSVTALPAIGPSIQWRKNGTLITGAFGPTLRLTNVSLSDAGNYSVVVSNAGTSITSNNATLTVTVPPVITTQPSNVSVTAGAPAQFSVVATPAVGPTFQWRKNGVPITGATNATLNIPSAALTDAGTYTVVVTNTGISVTSNSATLTVNVPVSTQPVTHTVTVGAFVQMNFTTTPAPGTTFQWRKEGVPIAGATNATLTINAATLADAGNYSVVFNSAGVSQTSNTATLVVVPVTAPVIAVQPASQTAVVGATVQFNVVATSPVAMTFQWRKNGLPIAGATNDALTLSNLALADAAAYSVAVTNSGGSTASGNAILTVNAPVGTAPTITSHPADQTVNAGATITLTIAASGTQPLAIQWFKNGNPIPAANAALLSIPNATATDSAAYTAVVTNSAGVATSNPANVTVLAPPVIALQPSTQTAQTGSVVQLSVAAIGSGTLTYQWRKDGTPLNGATNAMLSFPSVQPTDAGRYSVVVANAAGSVTSNVVTLTVAPGSRLSNVSIRTALAAGQTVIVGLAVDGGSRDVLVRAVGPSLATFGVAGAMNDPRLDLFSNTTLLASNDDWPATLATAFASVGAFGLSAGSRDSALRQGLNGSFSIHARGTGPGVVLVEAYDLGEGNTPRLVNVSARNRVGGGDDILIAGFTLSGTGSKQLLIRAVGPGLVPLGVSGVLTDPRLELFSGTGVKLSENDNWAPALAPTFTAVGAFALPAGSRDAAFTATLSPGSYTVQVRGVDGGTGEALVEIYEVP